MSLPFSRSLRSLQADSYRFSLAALLVGMALLIAWSAWFFLARMTLYETGRIVQTTRRGTFIADFASAVGEKLHRGQLAILYPQSPSGGQLGAFPATVTDVAKASREGRVRVELYPQAKAPVRRSVWANPTGSVEIEVEHVSPAILVRRTAAQFFNLSPATLRPETH